MQVADVYMSNKFINNRLSDSETEPKGNFSGNFAQFMVFVNGLILTVAAYLVLSFYLTNMLNSEVKNTQLSTELNIVENLQGLEQTMKTVATIVRLNERLDDTELKNQIYYATNGINNMDRLVFMDKKNGQWRARELYVKSDYQENYLPPLRKEIFVKDIIEATDGMTLAEDVFLITDYPGRVDFNLSIEPYVTANPMIIGKVLDRDRPEQGVVLGVGHTGRILDESWITDNANLSRIVLRDPDGTPGCLFFMRADRGTGRNCTIDPDNDSFTEIMVANKYLRLSVTAAYGESGMVLAKIPVLILVFGTLLTLLGTLYVRNNQKQAFRLADINRRLAQKNYDLNAEISERERLNHTLRKAEREYRATIDGVTDIIFEISTDGKILFMNDTWRRVTGFEVDQVTGRSLFDMIHHNDQQEQKKMFEEMVYGQRHAYRSFTKLRTSEGAFRSMELSMSMMRQDENRNLRVLGTFTDIEDRKRAEDALSEAEKKYRTIWENAAGGIYQVTPEGQFLTANPSLARIFGYDNTDHILSSVKNAHEQLYVHSQERAKFLRELETTGVVSNFEAQARTRGGDKIWVNESARAVRDDESRILYFEGSIEDITHRKESEIKLREAKVQSDLANRAKSEFLANMSHELRTPLNAIIGFSEIIKKEVLGPVQPKEYVEYSNDIYESGKRLLKIINEILDVSRIETGNRNLNEGRVSLEKVVTGCAAFMTPKADSMEVSITNMIGTDVPEIIGEEIAIKQIVLNLLSNAIKFTPDKGRVTLSYELDADGQLRLSVSDTGIGIDDAEIEKALSPFGQIETSFNRTASGAGLGLTLVNSLIKLHGGRLEIFSQKGLGTTATVVFPERRVSMREITKEDEKGDDAGEDDQEEKDSEASSEKSNTGEDADRTDTNQNLQ